jgi:hypothetical protein
LISSLVISFKFSVTGILIFFSGFHNLFNILFNDADILSNFIQAITETTQR